MAVTKDQLTEKYRGGPKGKAHAGTLVRVPSDIQMGGVPYQTIPGESPRWTLRAGVYEVTDLFARKTYNKPDSIGILTQPGVACSVRLDQIELVAVATLERELTKRGH